MNSKTSKGLKIAGIGMIVAVIVLIGGFQIYASDYYRADDHAMNEISAVKGNVETQGNMVIFNASGKSDSGTGFIFYPGGKVEAAAYAPLLQKLAREGVTCVLVRMPFNLAVFDKNAADGVYAMLPEIAGWYVGGHSLGGAMASSYASENSEKVKGLVLLGAYPVGDVGVPTLTLFGSNDEVIDRSRLEAVTDKIEIPGGNHAYFGDYGEQDGDGKAYITREEQQKQAVEAIIGFMGKR
jgi:hypothetical protein